MRRLIRLLWLLSQVCLAAAWGCVLRQLRRWKGSSPRIWRGMNGLHLIRWPVLVDRLAGFESRSFIASTQPASYALFRAGDFDVVCDQQAWPRRDWHWRGLVDVLLRADIRVAFFDSLFFPNSHRRANVAVLWLLRFVGIRTIMVPHCMDVFFRDGRVTRFDWVRRAQMDYADWDLSAHRAVAESRTRDWCRFADLVVSADSTCARFLPRRDLSFKWFPVDCQTLQPRELPARSRPVVVHAPQHRSIKGTQHLLDAIRNLSGEGVDAELRLVERVARDEALELYAEADIIADQFCMGAYGMFALEGMALGKPVLTYLDQEHLGDPAFDLPLVNANPDNLRRVLSVLLQVPELRTRIGAAGRAAVEKYQSIEAMAEVWSRIYRHVWWGYELDLAKTSHFSPERKARAYCEDPAQAQFWPVPVEDLMPQIRRAASPPAAISVGVAP